MSKLYYTDPLAAAYMAREFGVKLQAHYNVTQNLGDALTYDEIVLMLDFERFYIHPDSYHIFEPRAGDVMITEIPGTSSVEVVSSDIRAREFIDHLVEKRGAKIIQRQGKPFFWPEREDEKR